MSSISGLLVAVAVARTSTVAGTGRFGIAVAALLLVAALARSAVTDPLIADATRRPADTRLLGRASAVGLVGAVVLLAAGLTTSSAYLVIGALTVHGLTMRECVRAVLVATGSARTAVVLEGSWSAASALAFVGSLAGTWSGVDAFTIWAVSGAALGYAGTLRTHSDVLPVWSRTPVPSARSIAFASDTLIGSGVVQLVTWVATAVAGLSVAAALRGAGTLAGPVTVALSAARSLLIPRSVHHLGSNSPLRRFTADAALMAALALPALVALACVPDEIGSTLLGATWDLVDPILPLTAVELLFQLVAAVPESAHRALGVGRRILTVRCVTAVLRLPTVVAAAPLGIGVVVAVAAVITGLSAVAWWWSLATLLRPSTTVHVRPDVDSL
ncbi:hypothetical protein [Curtobacterium sp. MCBD17_021]|uniref:hypothetical protein n=1 Tax=Curtobacterium sp. MCBD17_021 TaxID=2175665 RepID=UPI0015E88469|nr:hypothetical protein [Curtobacterium sp. MCBD17_021]